MRIARRISPTSVEVVRLDPEVLARQRATRFRKRLLKADVPWVGFWLFTFGPEAMEGKTKPERHQYAMDTWKRYRARMWEAGLPFRFALVVEWTRRGWPHLHVLLDRYVPKQDKVNHQGETERGAEYHWRASGGGLFLKAKAIQGGKRGLKQAINYCCKYATKCVDRVKGCRRWSTTWRLLEVVRRTCSEWVRVTWTDVCILNLENDIHIDNGDGIWAYLPAGWVERSP